ncbi:MAG: X-Pro dipeptidyl-peptidase, partial [Massilia sp.]
MIRRTLPALVFGLCLAAGLASPSAAIAAIAADSVKDSKRPTREAYTKYEYRIPMRDGVQLFTVVYVPKDS